MRIAYHDYHIITDGDKFLGIALGYDYCSEHEWGINKTKIKFGIPEGSRKNMGVESRSITKSIKNLMFEKSTYKKNKFAILYTGRDWDDNVSIPHNLENYKKDILWRVEYDNKNDSVSKTPANLLTAWSDGDFGIAVMGEKEVKWLEELYEAFNNNNVVIAMINHRAINPFAGTSLSLMIKDRLPKEVSDMMYKSDKEYFDRVDYEKKTGVPKLIEKNLKARQKASEKNGSWKGNLYGHDHGYHIACSPKWIDYEDAENREAKKKEYNTKYDIIYWINYSDDENNYGHYTVEEIKSWLKGKKRLTEVRKMLNPKYV